MSTLPSKISVLKERFKQNETIKQQWRPIWQLCGEYVHTRQQHFMSSAMPGEFLTDQLFSSVAPEANKTMASALLGHIWPNGARSVILQRPHHILNTSAVKQYYNTLTQRFTYYLDQPEANLVPSMAEYFLELGSFGIGGIHRKKTGDLIQPLRFFSVSVANFVIEEDKSGRVRTIFIDDEYTVRQLVNTFGIKNVSKKCREAYGNGQYLDKVRVMWVIEPREDTRFAFGNKAFPISSIYFEWESGKILRESGFLQDPVHIARMLKAPKEIYGRSPAMFAMPAILRLNVIWEILQRNAEKIGNPPLYLLDSGALGGSIVDTSAGALSVFQTSGMGESSPIGQLFDVGDQTPLVSLVEQLTKEVTQAFMIDKLLDLNNESRMTLGEAQIRDRLRGDSMTAVYKRQENEMLTPVLQGAFNDLFELGLMGVVRGTEAEERLLQRGMTPLYLPAEVQRALEYDLPIYEIKYISPAARVMRTEQLQGLTSYLDMTIGAAQGFPTILDIPDPDAIAKELAELTGVPESKLNDDETIDAIRKSRTQQQQQQQQLEAAQTASDVNMKQAQAQSMMQGAINGRPRG